MTDWKKYSIFAAVIVAVCVAVFSLISPGKVPPVVLAVTSRAGQLCYLLEGNDREACAEIGTVASALSQPRTVPAGHAGGASP